MPHILLNRHSFNYDERFQTNSAILNITPYAPSVLIVGTYNERNIQGNEADFFYGRNYFWPVIYNLVNNSNILKKRRDDDGIPLGRPKIDQILNLCSSLKLTFADLILDVTVQLPNHDDRYLDRAIRLRKTKNNHQNIIEFLNENRSITHVYATTKFTQLKSLKALWDTIRIESRGDIHFGSILTPSGMGGIPNFELLGRAETIARYWVWVNHPDNPYGNFKNQKGYSHFDHNWLVSNGINPVIF